MDFEFNFKIEKHATKNSCLVSSQIKQNNGIVFGRVFEITENEVEKHGDLFLAIIAEFTNVWNMSAEARKEKTDDTP